MLVFGERLQGVDAAAGEQRGDDLERRVLGGGADQADGAALDVGQKGVLLRLVEAMDLVDEEDGARAELRGLFGIDHDLLDLLDAGEDGGELDEGGLGGAAMILARVVLPTPGGPQKIMEAGSSFDRMRSGLPGAEECSWPTYSSRVRGRMRSASGAWSGGGGSAARGAVSKRLTGDGMRVRRGRGWSGRGRWRRGAGGRG